jgi:acyl-CoA synthetase (AMP-forming)/AMP-acid ligase II
VWRRLLDAAPSRRLETLAWAMVGTSQVSVDLVEEIRHRCPRATVTVSYGSTEVGGAIRLHQRDLHRKPGSVGLPVPGVSARIDRLGELYLRSDSVMSGYFDRPEETAEVLADGWYRTGDLAERDDEGFFTIVGRRTEMIRTGGEWVPPIEVENALSDYPGLLDLAVIGHPDDDWGEVVCAVVVVQPGLRPPTSDELRRHIGGRLASFKHPRRVLTVDTIPRTAATGQVRRAELIRTEVVT